MENPVVSASEPPGVVATEKVQASLKGNTLRTYIYLVKAHPQVVGVREVQRALGFSSPNLSLYHLEKLVSLGLARSQGGEYELVKEVRIDVLQQFVKIGSFLLPRFIIYAVMFTVLLAYFVLQLSFLNFYVFWALVFGIAGTVISWYETISAWRQLP